MAPLFLIGGGADPDAVRASHEPFVAAAGGGPIVAFVLDEAEHTDVDRWLDVTKQFPGDQLARAGQSYRERDEQARLRQQRMIDYAEGQACRWGRILEYFDSDELAAACGRCDCCPTEDEQRLRKVS